jgi:hypothetical protein
MDTAQNTAPAEEPITAEDIIALLPIVADRDWRIGIGGAIRCLAGLTCHCPITALVEELTGEVFSVYETHQAISVLGLRNTSSARNAVEEAADSRDAARRTEILVALGLLPDRSKVRVRRAA